MEPDLVPRVLGRVVSVRHVKARPRANVVVKTRPSIDYKQAYEALLLLMAEGDRVVACLACAQCSPCPQNWRWCYMCRRDLCLHCAHTACTEAQVDDAVAVVAYYCEDCNGQQSWEPLEQDHDIVTVTRGGIASMMNT